MRTAVQSAMVCARHRRRGAAKRPLKAWTLCSTAFAARGGFEQPGGKALRPSTHANTPPPPAPLQHSPGPS
eukprot:353928-Chlamydomonas_euryale.AAC.7